MAADTQSMETEFSLEQPPNQSLMDAFNAPIPEVMTSPLQGINMMQQVTTKILQKVSKNDWSTASGKRSFKRVTTSDTPPVKTSNSFATLANENEKEKGKDKKVKVNPKVFPIDIILTPELPYSELYKKLKSSLEYPPTVYSIGRDVVRVNCACIADYKRLTELVKEEKIKHTFTSSGADRKPIKVVIRGLDKTTDPVLIKQVLEEDLNYKVDSVTQLKSQRKKGSLLPLFLVTLINDGRQNDIKDVNFLMCVRVTIESYRTPTLPRQCFKCQRYDHVSRNCHADSRCVKCGESHTSKECSLTDKEKFACANCQGNHTANYKGCVDYKKAKQRISKNRPKTPNAPVKPTGTPRNAYQPNKSYVSVTKPQMAPRSNKTSATAPTRKSDSGNAPAAPGLVSSQKPTPSVNSSSKNNPASHAILDEYMKLFDEALQFSNQSASGKVSVLDAIAKAGVMIKKLTDLGLKAAKLHG